VTPDIAAHIRDEQVRVLYRQARVVFIPNVVATPAIVYVLWSALPHVALLSWLAAMYLVTALRAFLVWMYGRVPREGEENRRWGWALAAMNMVSGAGWGAAGFYFVGYSDPLSQAFVIVTLAAMASGGVGSLSAFFPAYAMFAIACVGPLIARTLVEWRAVGGPAGTTYLLLGVLSLVYLAVHLFFSRNTERALVESIRLRFEKLNLVEQLTVQKERAEAANVAKSRFLAAASHDLRQPIHALTLFVGQLQAVRVPPQAQALVQRIERSVDALEALFEALLDLSRLDVGIVMPQPKTFPLQDLLSRLVADFAPAAEAKGLALTQVPTSLWVRSDPLLLDRILQNLVANAIRYTVEGRVLIGCRRCGEHVDLVIADSGVGIDPLHMPNIFQEFYRVGLPREDKAQGLGLGLAIVQRISLLLDHPVSVASVPGKGTIVRVRVPRAAAEDRAVVQEPVVGQDLRGTRVLVVDDEAAAREAMQGLLAQWGCDVITARGGDDAVPGTRNRRPDVVLCDLRLADGESGLEVVRRLRAEHGSGLACAFITGESAPERLVEVRASGDPIAFKPTNPGKLRALIEHLLARTIKA
jgi:signal transduction histidine kinase